MFSLSTSWNSSAHDNGFDLVEEIRGIGFDTIELGFSLTRKIVEEILSLKEAELIKVSSLHNMCPLPDEIEPARSSPDYYSLASIDECERRRAISVVKNTVLYAGRFDARAVILHTGRVEMKDRTRELAALLDQGERYNILKDEMVEERRIKSRPHIDNLLKSLKEVIPYALESGVKTAIETRYYYREIPLMEEFEEIFSHFKPGELFYWHDAGHAEVFERLGLARHKEFLEKFSNRLIGIHLHDIIDHIKDHNAPGAGTFDFNILKPYMRKDTIKVIEAHKPATADDILRGVEYLERIFGR